MISKNDESKFIELKEICDIMEISDMRTVMKWCEDRKILIFFIGRKKMAHRFLVEAEFDALMIKQLKLKYPNIWKELFKCYKNEDYIGFNDLIHEEQEIGVLMVSTKAKSKYAKEFLKM